MPLRIVKTRSSTSPRNNATKARRARRQPQRKRTVTRAQQRRRPGGRTTNFAPVAFGASASNQRSATTPMRGSEILGTFPITTDMPSGEILFVAPVNPRQLIGTRLGKTADLYDLYKISNFSLEIISSSPTSTAGSYIAAIDPDARVDYPGMAAQSRIRALSQVPGGKINSLFMKSTIRLAVNRRNEWLFCDSANDEVYKTTAGNICVCLNAPLAGISGTIYLTLKISYNIIFKGQNLEEPVQTAMTHYTTAPQGFLPSDLNYLLVPLGSIPIAYDNRPYIVVASTPEEDNLPEDLQEIFRAGYRYISLLSSGEHSGQAWMFKTAEDARLTRSMLTTAQATTILGRAPQPWGMSVTLVTELINTTRELQSSPRELESMSRKMEELTARLNTMTNTLQQQQDRSSPTPTRNRSPSRPTTAQTSSRSQSTTATSASRDTSVSRTISSYPLK